MSTSPRTAVILAAGVGLRLRGVYEGAPKGLIEVGRETLIGRSVRLLEEHGIRQIIVVAGYKADAYERFATGRPALEIVYNDRFTRTGSLMSLAVAMPRIEESHFLLLESDIFYEARALDALIASKHDNIVLGSQQTGAGDEVWVTEKEGRIVNLSKDVSGSESRSTEFVGVNKVSKALAQDMASLVEGTPSENTDSLSYETDGFVRLASRHPIHLSLIPDLLWGEIDDESQLIRVRNRVAPIVLKREERLRQSALR